jgi:hypothetical protein
MANDIKFLDARFLSVFFASYQTSSHKQATVE